MAASLKVRLAQAHGMNARWCHQALERINFLEKQGTTLRDQVAFVVNHGGMEDHAYDLLVKALEEFDK